MSAQEQVGSSHHQGQEPVNVTRVQVRFAETDMAGVYHHRNLFTWLEEGRFHLLGNMMGDAGMFATESAPIFAPVTRARARFNGFARFQDRLVLETLMVWSRSTKLTFYYRLRQEDARPVALACTEHVALGPDQRLLFRWPEHVAERLAAFLESHSYVLTDGSEFDGKL